MTVVFASPAQAVAASAPAGGLSMSWTGWDGSVWDLSQPEVSGLFLGAQARGLGAPDADRFSTVSPALAGSRHRGSRILEREVFWPLHILGDPGSAWVGRDGAFWRTMRPDAPGVWSVTGPDGSTRSLTCRWVSTEDSFLMDPTRVGWASYGVYLVADEDPYWSGAPVVRSFSPGEPVDFFDPAGSPPFHISAGNLLASATVDNPGDVESHPIWRVDGPVTDVEVGVQGRVIEVPIEVAGGESLTIDTSPTAQTAIRSGGEDVTSQLGAVDFAPIPAGDVVPLSLSMVGTGTVTVTLPTRYLRAFG